MKLNHSKSSMDLLGVFKTSLFCLIFLFLLIYLKIIMSKITLIIDNMARTTTVNASVDPIDLARFELENILLKLSVKNLAPSMAIILFVK